ncbi:hypothetical protein SDJN03_08367, partial [Cucurbita argyrosperma subsp. sororia]
MRARAIALCHFPFPSSWFGLVSNQCSRPKGGRRSPAPPPSSPSKFNQEIDGRPATFSSATAISEQVESGK